MATTAIARESPEDTSLRELAVETDNSDVLEAISALEMMLTFQNALGGLFGYEDDDWYDEPF